MIFSAKRVALATDTVAYRRHGGVAPTAFAILLLVTGTACSHASPAAPTPGPTSEKPDAPVAVARLTVDNLASQDAIAGLSVVMVDATASTGTNLKYRVEFGDGTVINDRVARHVYETTGSYQVAVTVTDATERTAAISRPVIVSSPLGTWLYAGFLSGVRQVEVQRLTLTSQETQTIHGTLATRGRERSITGQLLADRRIRLVTDDRSETLEGVMPSELRSESSALTLGAHGSGVDGETFIFTHLLSEPTGAPPDAVLKMRFFSFSAPFAIKQISPIQFDGSTSRGESLKYFIEFGDQQVTSDATSVHPIRQAGQYTARLTVVDRFGRWDSEAMPYEVQALVLWNPPNFEYWFNDEELTVLDAILGFTAQDGTAVSGIFRRYVIYPQPPKDFPFTGTVTADGEVQLSLVGSNVVLNGSLTLGPRTNDKNMVLTITGDGYHGERIRFRPRYGYD
jgi:PKD repeat protein